MNFKSVDKKYRPIPFWSWNEKLECDETRRQVGVMDGAGIGGFFMHARGGLMTEYMGKEWFDNVRAASDEAHARGMHPWAYDENGWPSGFGGGRINGLGLEYQQKALNCEPLTEENADMPNTVARIGAYRYYYAVNEFYVDVLDKKVVAEFIEQIYCEYERRMGNSFEGFFTDEPQIMRVGSYPWSFTLQGKFSEKYGYDLLPRLNELFFNEGSYERTRVDFWRLVTELFSENFFKQIYEWCESRGYKFTGHLLLEEDMFNSMRSSGASMPHYEYFTIPGMDWLGRRIGDCLTHTALGSAAAQLGKKQVLSETFALAGHNVSHSDLKRIYEWQMVRGVNLLCTHLEGYSLRGIRKRDYPPAMYYQQPWWCDMNIFFDAMSRIGMLLAEGKVVADTLIIQPQSTAWKLYRGDAGESASSVRANIRHYNDALLAEMKKLERKHILYHLGDELLMQRHARAEDGKLLIGEMSYSRVIIPENLGLLPETASLLDEFVKCGGKIVSADEVLPNPITEENDLTYTKRVFDNYDLHYIVNSTDSTISATFAHGNLALDIVTGETYDFYGSHTFAPTESLVLFDTHEQRARRTEEKKTEKLSLLGEWRLKDASYNSITLDRCDYYFDGELIAKGGYVLDILPRINERRRATELTQVYRFEVEDVPRALFLCIETPEMFTVTLGGVPIDMTVRGNFVDKSFKLIDIAGAVRCGVNELVIKSTVVQSAATYEHLSKSWAFETMKNSLSYDMEIEPIYIVGDFGAKIKGDMKEFEPVSYRIDETPVITAMPEYVTAEALDASGYPMFAGTLTLERTFELDATDKHVRLAGRGINSLHLKINGKPVETKLFAPFDVDISPYIIKGRNVFELTVVNNLRNMQGPLHINGGDTTGIGPGIFYRESNVFSHAGGKGEDCHEVLGHFNECIGLVYFGILD